MPADITRSKKLKLILAARTEGLPEQLGSTCFVPMSHREAITVLEDAGLWLGPRPSLEEMEDFRQIIPYIVLVHGSHLIHYTRSSVGKETRLHGRTSVGLGGHIDLSDVETLDGSIDLTRTLENAADRELQEELGEIEITDKKWVGLLVENDSAVGRVHIGMIGIWRLNSMPLGVVEDALANVSSRSISEIGVDGENMETWSAVLMPWLSDMVLEP
jgi:predicted NUDIX family phosphoesterase